MKALFTLITALLLSACTSPNHHPIQYFLLDSAIDSTAQNNNTDSKTILLKKLQLADYLQSANLPVIHHGHNIKYAKHSAWAEPVQEGIERALSSDFNRQNKYKLILNDMPNSKLAEYQLHIKIDHFSATDNSKVILAGTYWLIQNNHILSEQYFHFNQILVLDGFNHSVSQQRQLIRQLANKLIKDSALQ